MNTIHLEEHFLFPKQIIITAFHVGMLVIVPKRTWFIADSICNLNDISIGINSWDWVGSITSSFQFINKI